MERKEGLQRFRAQLDDIDNRILGLLNERFAVTREVGRYKRKHDLPPSDPAREAQQMETISAKATEAGVDPEMAQRIFRTIIDQVVQEHHAIRQLPASEL